MDQIADEQEVLLFTDQDQANDWINLEYGPQKIKADNITVELYNE